jgi:hypothetical protein
MVVIRNVTTTSATMPKATVDKDSHAFFVEGEIWFAENSGGANPPTLDACLDESGAQPPFCGSVSLPTNGGHDLRTL